MLYYRCKCGDQIAHSSMGVPKCDGCKKCNTTLELRSTDHTEPEPHEFVTKFDQNTGKPYEICNRCFKRKDIIDKE